jgi:tetratricopeptide (TPR) repeat protein
VQRRKGISGESRRFILSQEYITDIISNDQRKQMKQYLILFCIALLHIFLHDAPLFASSNALVAVDSAARAEANAFFQQQDWKNAAARYQAIVKEEPKNGGAWFRFGIALHGEGKYKEAIEPYKRALSLQFQTTNATFRLARVYAALKQKGQALQALEKVVRSGFAIAKQVLEMESDFDALRSEPRYATIIAQAEKNMCAACDAVPEHRQFDFWVGEWDVRPFATPKVQPTARSIIERANGNCTIVENYYTKGGYVGKSFNIYDATQRKWRQFWNDNSGTVIEFFGEYDATEKALKYRSESVNAQGQKQMGKMTFYNLADGNVRQIWEMSTDDGKTWSVAFDGLYTLRK